MFSYIQEIWLSGICVAVLHLFTICRPCVALSSHLLFGNAVHAFLFSDETPRARKVRAKLC